MMMSDASFCETPCAIDDDNKNVNAAVDMTDDETNDGSSDCDSDCGDACCCCDCDCDEWDDMDMCPKITDTSPTSLDKLRSNDDNGGDDDCCIHRVELVNCAADIVELCRVLRHSASVEEIILDGIEGGMTLDDVRALADLLRTSRTISEFQLLRTDIGGDAGLHLLSAAIASNSSILSMELTELGATITAKGAVSLVRALAHNSTLSYLTIVGNNFGDVGASYFARLILEGRRSALVGLSLINCGVGDRGAVAFAAGLAHRCSKTTSLPLAALCLTNNHIGERGALALAGVFRACPALRCLDLEQNDFSSRGEAARELARATLLNAAARQVLAPGGGAAAA